MLKSLGRFHSLVIPVFTWLVLLIPFFIYQRYYVSSQQAYLTGHGFRILAAVGRQLNSYIDSISKTVASAPSDIAPALGRLSLDDAFRERLRGIGEDYFDDVLIANSKGEVLF